MFSSLFCGTLETSTQDFNLKKEDDNGLRLFKIDLLKYQESVSILLNVLSSSERDRASRYHFIKDKNRFIICRSLLKILLAEYTGLPVDKILLDIDANKKPYLPSHPLIFFNVSHAGDYAIIGISKSPIGVDVEYNNKDFDYQEILPNIFNKIEIDQIFNSKVKHHTFYKFWTRKEAIVKAIGKGIDGDISKITVTDGQHAIPSSLVCDFKKINVYSFNLNDDYIGAFAITDNKYNLDRIVFSTTPTIDELKSLYS